MFRVAVSGRREQEPSFFTVIVWRDQAEHAAQSLSKGSRVVAVSRLQQRTWTAEDGSARSVVEVVAEELGPSLRWATATSRTTRNSSRGLTDGECWRINPSPGAASVTPWPPPGADLRAWSEAYTKPTLGMNPRPAMRQVQKGGS
jgi:single-strand DNA-binding protein